MDEKKKTVGVETYKKAILEMIDDTENVRLLKKIYDYIYRNIKRTGN